MTFEWRLAVAVNPTCQTYLGTSGSILFSFGSPLSTSKNSVKQIYIQGPAGSKYVLKNAMVCTNAYLEEYIATGISNMIAAPKAQNNVRYNFAGQRVGNGAKMYIMNGKKYMK